MRVNYLPRALEALDDAPTAVRKAFFKQIQYLERNLRHPSLRPRNTTNRKICGRRVSIRTGGFILQ